VTTLSASTLPPSPVSFDLDAPPAFLSPADMARRLRQAYSEDARCFAATIHEESAWANERWAAYWADVLRLV